MICQIMLVYRWLDAFELGKFNTDFTRIYFGEIRHQSMCLRNQEHRATKMTSNCIDPPKAASGHATCKDSKVLSRLTLTPILELYAILPPRVDTPLVKLIWGSNNLYTLSLLGESWYSQTNSIQVAQAYSAIYCIQVEYIICAKLCSIIKQSPL